jgi:hypothetical protein
MTRAAITLSAMATPGWIIFYAILSAVLFPGFVVDQRFEERA